MLFHVCDPVNCGAYKHALVESPHRVVAGIQIRTVRRLQRGRNEKIMRRERDCFWNTNILDFQISQGSVATQLRWGGSLYNRSIENKISQWKNCENRCSFAKVMTKKQSGCLFSRTRCSYARLTFYSCDLDLDPITLIYELDLDNVDIYMWILAYRKKLSYSRDGARCVKRPFKVTENHPLLCQSTRHLCLPISIQ